MSLYSISFAALTDLVAFCRGSAAKAGDKQGPPDAGAVPEHIGANVCPPELQPDRVSAFLLQLSPSANIEEVKFALARLPDVRIIEGNNVLTSSRQALSSLLIGIARIHGGPAHRTADPDLATVLGDRPGALPRIRSAARHGREARSGDGDHFGRGGDHHRARRSRRACLRRGPAQIFARSLGFYFGLLGIPFSWPPPRSCRWRAVVAVGVSAVLGLVGAFRPAGEYAEWCPTR